MKTSERLRILCWLGVWRDRIPAEAVSGLQDILGVPFVDDSNYKPAAQLNMQATDALQGAETSDEHPGVSA